VVAKYRKSVRYSQFEGDVVGRVPDHFMNLTLSSELEAFVRQKVESGQYGSFAQVIEDGLLLLEERDHVMGLRRERLLHELAAGVDQANSHQLIGAADVYRGLADKSNSYNE
jgi:antitoxin ParD1/3/4